MSRLVTATLRDEFRDQGVVFIGKALDADSMRMAEDAYSWSLAHPSPGAANFPHKDAPATSYQDLANQNAIPAYRAMLEQSPNAAIPATLSDAPDVWSIHAQDFIKDDGKASGQ